MLDVSPEDLEAIVITHHHGDHGGGALIAQKRWKVPVYANHRTNAELGLLPELTRPFEALDVLPFNNGISLLPVPVPHSGADNVAFVASHGGERSAIITDLGSWTDELVHHVRGCQHIAVEANYDQNRLISGPYPSSLKDRITGRGGHLSNLQTGEFLAQVCSDKTRSITLTHLSEMNNAPHLAESTVLFEIDEVFEGDINISLQDDLNSRTLSVAEMEMDLPPTPFNAFNEKCCKTATLRSMPKCSRRTTVNKGRSRCVGAALLKMKMP